MSALNDWFWDLLEVAEERLDSYLWEEDGLDKFLQALGASLLGLKTKLPVPGQQAVGQVGRRMRRELKEDKPDQAALAEQRRRIARVSRYKSLSSLHKMDPGDFEHWVAGYFKRKRFRNVRVTQLSADFGIDIYMTCRNGAEAVVQVKRYKGSVGRPVIQQTYGAMHLVGASRCYVVTCGSFAKTARELESAHKDILLIDGQELVRRK